MRCASGRADLSRGMRPVEDRRLFLCGSKFDPSAAFHIEKTVVGSAAADVEDLRLPVKQSLHIIASPDISRYGADWPQSRQLRRRGRVG